MGIIKDPTGGLMKIVWVNICKVMQNALYKYIPNKYLQDKHFYGHIYSVRYKLRLFLSYQNMAHL